MSGRKFLAQCSAGGCVAALVLVAESVAAARALVRREYGWGGTGENDLCPTHTEARSET